MNCLVRFMTVAAVLTGAFGAGGCGGSSDDNDPTKAQFIKEADATCKKAHDGFAKAFNQAFPTQPTQAQRNEFAKSTLVPGVQGEIDDIRDLEAPSADQDQVDAILDAEQNGVDKVKADPAILSPL